MEGVAGQLSAGLTQCATIWVASFIVVTAALDWILCLLKYCAIAE